MKKIISLLLTITMAFCITTSIPLNTSAVTTDKVKNSLIYTDQYGSWTYELTDNKNGYRITGYDESMAVIEIPSMINNLPVLEIGYKTFYNHLNITSITVPNSVTFIDDYAFANCYYLKEMTLSENITSIGDYTFYNCNQLTDITIPEKVTSIGNKAFSLCVNLASITLSKNITSIGNSAFYKCHIIDNITIPQSVTYIGNSAFSSCYNITNIVIPNNVTFIGDSAFSNCSSLTNIKIPDSVSSIGNSTFNLCTNLNNVHYTGSEEQWNSILIGNNNDCLTNATIHFNYIEPKPGDISGDGEIAVDDVIYVLKYVVGNIELTAEQLTMADLNGDGELTVLDALILQKLILETF